VRRVYPAGIDTDMLAGIEAPKAPAVEVAASLLDGLVADQEDIIPDPERRGRVADVVGRPDGVRARVLRRGGLRARLTG
jgi:hypothetical protein